MLRIRTEVGKGLEIDRCGVASFACGNNGANVHSKVVCVPRIHFAIAKVEVYSVVKVAAGTNTLDVGIGKRGDDDLVVTAADPNAVVTAGHATIAAQPDIPRRMRMTLADNAGVDLVVTATVYGTDSLGRPLTEVLTNAVAGTGTTTGTQKFKEVKLVTLVIDAGAADAADTIKLGTVDETVVTQFDPDTLTAGAAPSSRALLGAADDIPAHTPVWVSLVTDNGAVAAPPDVGVVVHWEPYLGAYDGEVAYGAYDA
jgi:hypothetical protein